MKKITILLTAMLIGVSSMFAGPGFRVSYDYTNPGSVKMPNTDDIKSFSSGSGVAVGFVYRVPLILGLYVEPGISLYYDTFKDEMGFITTGDGFDTQKLTVKTFGMRVPIVAGYRFGLGPIAGLSIFTGPQFGYGFYGKYDLPDRYDNGDYDDNYYGDNGMRRFNVDWRLGAQVDLFKKLIVGIGYDFGLNDLKKDKPSFKVSRMTVSVGINF